MLRSCSRTRASRSLAKGPGPRDAVLGPADGWTRLRGRAAIAGRSIRSVLARAGVALPGDTAARHARAVADLAPRRVGLADPVDAALRLGRHRLAGRLRGRVSG